MLDVHPVVGSELEHFEERQERGGNLRATSAGGAAADADADDVSGSNEIGVEFFYAVIDEDRVTDELYWS